MLRSPRSDQMSEQELHGRFPAPISARIGIEDVESPVSQLTGGGFAVAREDPKPVGTLTYASFRMPAGLSISLPVIARSWQEESGQQWFEFGQVDAEVVNLLVLTSAAFAVH